MDIKEFKIGDRVKLIDTKDEFYEDYKGFLNETGTIIGINRGRFAIVKFDTKGVIRNPYLHNLELIENAKVKTLSDVKEGDIITLKNGEKLIVTENKNLADLNSNPDNPCSHISDFKSDLTYNGDEISLNIYDIVKIERHESTGKVVFDRSEVIKKMTLSEICKELGYRVEIIKEREER